MSRPFSFRGAMAGRPVVFDVVISPRQGGRLLLTWTACTLDASSTQGGCVWHGLVEASAVAPKQAPTFGRKPGTKPTPRSFVDQMGQWTQRGLRWLVEQDARLVALR